jgi:ribonuclease HII
MHGTLIGVDEAGYGPNFGPLIVAATRWEVPIEAMADNRALDQLLTPFVQRTPVGEDLNAIAIADSKQLYSSGAGLGELERGVLSCLEAAHERPTSWKSLWGIAAPACTAELNAAIWRADYDEPLPCAVGADVLDVIAANFRANLAATDVRLVAMRAVAVFPAEFNRLVEQHGNKASALSETSLSLFEELLPDDDSPTLVHCDKHGGRKRYGPLLQSRFPDDLVVVRKETQRESAYALGGSRRQTTVRFVAKGDEFFPAALASMLAKYLREQAMKAFNAFWAEHVPGLKPTAGYPVDAKRFRRDIADAKQRLDIDDHELWRSR